MRTGRLYRACRLAALRAWSALGLAAALAVVPAPASPVSRAVRWLLDRQSASGSWDLNPRNVITDTLQAAASLEAVGDDVAHAAALRARGRLLLTLDPQSALTSDRLAVFLCNASDNGAALLAVQNPDGGWPMALGQQSNVLDTAMIAEALAVRGVLSADSARAAAIWLTAQQQADGFWTLSADGGPGRLELTACVVRALDALRHAGLDAAALAAVNRAVDAALPPLRAAFRSDGRFALDADLAKTASVTETAEVYRTLVRFDPPGVYSNALALLENLQRPDGGWSETGNPDQDVYATASAILALCAVRTPDPGALPDLLVTASGLWFAPARPHSGQPVVAHAVVFNTGTAAATNVQAAFFRGDPRTDGEQIGDEQIISSLPVSGSAHVQVMFETASLAASPRVFVVVDPGNAVAETDITNNIASKQLEVQGLAPASPPHGPNLHISAAGVTFNQAHASTLILNTGPMVDVGVLLENTGDQPMPSARIDVRDGAALIARITAPEIPPGESVTVRFPWAPAAGGHALHLVGDPDQTIAETDESDNALDMALQVIGNTCTVIVKRWVAGQELDPPCAAYDVVRLTATSAYRDARIDLRILGPDGEPASVPPTPLAVPGVWQWNVGNAPPGTYTVRARYLQPETESLLDRAEARFNVQPTTALRGLRVSLPRSVVDGGPIAPLPVTVTLANGGNQDADWDITWKVYDPNGTLTLASTTAQTVRLLAVQMSRQVVLDEPITGTLTVPGRYTVVVETARPGDREAVATAQAFFSLLPPLHLTVTNTVVPDRVAPLGKVRVRTILRLAAGSGDDAADAPTAIRRIEVHPQDDIEDAPTAGAVLIGEGVVNSLGQTVPDGTKIAVHALYGSISSGIAAPEADPASGIRVVEVRNGTVRLEYTPAGTALESGERSVVPVRFYQYFPGRTRWLGKNIATAEIFLAKP